MNLRSTRYPAATRIAPHKKLGRKSRDDRGRCSSSDSSSTPRAVHVALHHTQQPRTVQHTKCMILLCLECQMSYSMCTCMGAVASYLNQDVSPNTATSPSAPAVGGVFRRGTAAVRSASALTRLSCYTAPEVRGSPGSVRGFQVVRLPRSCVWVTYFRMCYPL